MDSPPIDPGRVVGAEHAGAPDHVVAGRVRAPDGVWRRGEVWITAARISAVTDTVAPERTPGVPRTDVGDSFVLPGLVDSHVHSLSHQGEGVLAATRAAAAGGVTTIVEMPFDKTGPIDSVDRLRTKQDLANDESVVDVALLATMSPSGGWRAADDLAAAGAIGFKVSLFLTDPHRFPRIDDLELLSVMSAAADSERVLCVHAENNEIVKGLLAREAAGDGLDPHAHTRSRPPVSETVGVLTALEVAADRGAALHLCHVSLPRSVDLVQWYAGQGIDVTMETCPHYLHFSEDDLLAQGGRLKINPPLRTTAAREGLWGRIADRRIPIIASDHAPWPAGFKDHRRILENHSGVPGVETMAAVVLGQALRRDPTLAMFSAAVDALTVAPARRFGLADRKGSFDVGKDADLAVFTPGDVVIDGAAQHSNAGWSPYDGVVAGGAVTLTISRGQTVWSTSDGLRARPGRGEVLARAGGR